MFDYLGEVVADDICDDIAAAITGLHALDGFEYFHANNYGLGFFVGLNHTIHADENVVGLASSLSDG